MNRVVIAGRTRMQGNHVCIGGHDLDHAFRSVRLIHRSGSQWHSDAPFMVGDVWDIDYRKNACRPPHLEDVTARRYRRLALTVDLRALVLQHLQPWTGGPDLLFDGCVRGTPSGTAYVPAGGRLPSCSTGYWIPSRPLVRQPLEKPKFRSTGESAVKQFSWVGVEDPPQRIEAGSLVRMSLARLFRPETAPHGYYVQISGVL